MVEQIKASISGTPAECLDFAEPDFGFPESSSTDPLLVVLPLISFLAGGGAFCSVRGLTRGSPNAVDSQALGEEDSRAVYDRYHVAAPGRIIWDGALANFQPHSEAKVNFKRERRAPLLFIASSEDHLMPPAVNKANYELQKQSAAVTAYVEFAGRCHYTCGQDGWEPVADLALSWAMRYARPSAQTKVSDVRTAVSSN